MKNEELIQEIKKIKEDKGYTLHEISKILDIHISTIERWLRTKRINKVYANLVKTKLKINIGE